VRGVPGKGVGRDKGRDGEMRQCVTCDYWFPIEEAKGQCRVKPPQLTIIPIMGAAPQGLSIVKGSREQMQLQIQQCTSFPETTGEQWCGEYIKVMCEKSGGES
jgi:hypothetical protein